MTSSTSEYMSPPGESSEPFSSFYLYEVFFRFRSDSILRQAVQSHPDLSADRISLWSAATVLQLDLMKRGRFLSTNTEICNISRLGLKSGQTLIHFSQLVQTAAYEIETESLVEREWLHHMTTPPHFLNAFFPPPVPSLQIRVFILQEGLHSLIFPNEPNPIARTWAQLFKHVSRYLQKFRALRDNPSIFHVDVAPWNFFITFKLIHITQLPLCMINLAVAFILPNDSLLREIPIPLAPPNSPTNDSRIDPRTRRVQPHVRNLIIPTNRVERDMGRISSAVQDVLESMLCQVHSQSDFSPICSICEFHTSNVAFIHCDPPYTACMASCSSCVLEWEKRCSALRSPLRCPSCNQDNSFPIPISIVYWRDKDRFTRSSKYPFPP